MYVQQVFIVFIKFLMFFVKLKIFLCRMYLVRLSVTDVALGGRGSVGYVRSITYSLL